MVLPMDPLRDLALILDTLALIGDRERGMELVQAVSKELSEAAGTHPNHRLLAFGHQPLRG